jgi:hypothetical protein
MFRQRLSVDDVYVEAESFAPLILRFVTISGREVGRKEEVNSLRTVTTSANLFQVGQDLLSEVLPLNRAGKGQQRTRRLADESVRLQPTILKVTSERFEVPSLIAASANGPRRGNYILTNPMASEFAT